MLNNLETALGLGFLGVDMVLRMVMAAGNSIMVVNVLWPLEVNTFGNELFDAGISVLWHALDLVDQATKFQKIDLRHTRDLSQFKKRKVLTWSIWAISWCLSTST